jgi:hypothetical protein
MFDAGAIVARMELDLKGWKRSIEDVKADTGSVRGIILRNEDAIRRLGVSIGIAGAGMTLVLKSWAKAAIDAVESENLFIVSLGRLEGAARSWSETYSKAVGANAYETRRMVGTLHVMLSNMGLVEERSLGMSERLTELVNDMASFYNITVEQAFEKITAGLTGEMEPLKRLGILVDDTTAKHYALANGIAKNWAEADQATKAYVRYRLILDQTTAAQGDLLRTQDSQANQLRRIQNQYEEFKIEMGRGLLPVMGEMLESVSGITAGLVDWAKTNPELASSIGLVTTAVTGLMVVLSPFLLALPTLAKLPWGAIAKIGGAVALLSLKGGAELDTERLEEISTLTTRLNIVEESLGGLAAVPERTDRAQMERTLGIYQRSVADAEKLVKLLEEAEAEGRPVDALLVRARYQASYFQQKVEQLSGLIAAQNTAAVEIQRAIETKTEEPVWHLWDAVPRGEQPIPWEEVSRVLDEVYAEMAREEEERSRQLAEIEAERIEIHARLEREFIESRKSAWQKAFESLFADDESVTRYRRFMSDITAGWENAIGSFLDDMVHDFDLSLSRISALFDAFFESILRAWIAMAAEMAAEELFSIAAPSFAKVFRFASGGRVERPTLAVIGDDPRGPERVLSGPENAAYERGLGRPAHVSIEIRNETGMPMAADATVSQADTENLVIGIVTRRISRDRSFRDFVRGGR